jgi:ribosome assembly protein 4
MATLLPPPKRQKVYHGIPEPEKSPVEQSPNIVVHFVSEDDGSALAPAISLPANISRDDLQGLVNRLTSKVRCIEYGLSFHIFTQYDAARLTNLSLSNFTSRYQLML